MKKLFQLSIMMLLISFSAFSQDEFDIISAQDIPVKGIVVSATLSGSDNKALTDYAMSNFKMKAPSVSVGNIQKIQAKTQTTTYNLTQIKLTPTDPKSKAEGVIIILTDDKGKEYKALVYSPDGTVESSKEYIPEKQKSGKVSVGLSGKQLWSCVKSSLLSSIPKCAAGAASCGATSIWGWLWCAGSKCAKEVMSSFVSCLRK